MVKLQQVEDTCRLCMCSKFQLDFGFVEVCNGWTDL